MVDSNQQTETLGIMGSISGVVAEALDLVRGEFALARAEVGEKVSGLIGAVMMAMAGLALIIASLVILLDAAVYALALSGVHPGWSALIIGGGAVTLGAILLMAARARFKPGELTPEKTVAQLREDSETLKEVRK